MIGGPGARAPNAQVTKYYVRCCGEVRFRNTGRICVVGAACNASFLLLRESRALSLRCRFSEIAWRASQICRPNDEEKAEISVFTSVGHLGTVFQRLGCDLDLRNVKNLPGMATVSLSMFDSIGYLVSGSIFMFISLGCTKQVSLTTSLS